MPLRKGLTRIICPACKNQLTIYGSMELELPGRGASIYTFQWFKCQSCKTTYYGELEEFLDVFNDDLIHVGYEAEQQLWQSSLGSLKSCPDLDY